MTDTTAEMLMPTQPTATEQAAGTQQSQEAQLREFLDALEAEFTREAAMQEAARHGRTRDFTEERKRLEEKQKTATEKEAQQIRIELSAIEQKRADFNLAQHTDEAWVKNATVTLLKAEERLLAYAHMHPDNTSVQTTVTRMRENIQKGLRGLGEINDIKSRPQPVESEIASLTLSHAAMDRLTQMLIGKDVTFDQLRAEEKQVIGEKMIKLALFIRQNPSLQQFFETEQGLTEDKEVIMHAADVLEAQSREIIGQEKADKIVEDFGGKSTESWTQQEREAILEFLGDPTGKIRKTFTDENGVLDRIAYKKYRDAILKNAQTPSVLEKILHTFAKGLGTKTTLESFLKSGFESEDEHIRLQMLQERMRQEADKKLKTPEAARARGEVRDYLVGTFGDEADPMLFMEAAQKVMARVKREIAHLPPAEQTRRLLEEAGKLVALYSGPINDGDPKAYGLSALLEGEASEVVCTVRGMILHQLLEEVLPEKNWVILAQHQSVTFNENGEIKDPAHVRLVVLDLATKDKTTQRPVGYFVDPLFGNEKAMVSKIDEQEIARIADAYEAYRQNPRRGTLRIETSSGTVGFADSVLMADNMANMATFLYSEGDMEQARVFAEAALAEYESSEAQLILANIAQQDGQSNPQENLDAAKELNPALEKLQETNPEKYASYVGNIEQQRIKATPDEYVNEYSRLRGAGATKKEWKAFFDKLYGEISSFQATNGQYSTELSSDIYRLNSYLITFLREFYQGGQVTDGITESEAKKWGRQYEALVRIGDVEVAIGRGDFQTANTALEKFSWEAQYGAYKDFEGLGVALRTVERTAFDALTRDEGIFNHHQDEMKNAAKAALKADRSWYKGAPEDFEAAVNTASDLAYRYYYTDFTWSVRMAFGRRQLGLSKYGGQKGQTLTELFNPIFTKQSRDDMTEMEWQMITRIGRANVEAATRGLNDGPGMLSHRGLILKSIVEYHFLTNQALHRQMRNAMSKEGYEKERAKLAADLVYLKQERAAENFGSYVVGETPAILRVDKLVQEHLKAFRQKKIAQGYSVKDLNDFNFFRNLVEEEMWYTDFFVKRFDATAGVEREYFDQEILANQLLYGEALTDMANHFANADELYAWIDYNASQTQAAENAARRAAGLPLDERTQRKIGTELFANTQAFMYFMYESNLPFEIASGKAARAMVEAEKSIRESLAKDPTTAFNPNFDRDYRAAKARQATAETNLNTGLTVTYIAEVTALRRAEIDLSTKQEALQRASGADYARLKREADRARTDYNTAKATYDTVINPLQAAIDAEKTIIKRMEDSPSGKIYKALELSREHRANLLRKEADYRAAVPPNTAMATLYRSYVTKADASILAIETAVRDPRNYANLEAASLNAKKAVVQRLTWEQILTQRNYEMYMQKKGTPITNIAKANRDVAAMTRLYDTAGKFIAGKGNWQRLNDIARATGGSVSRVTGVGRAMRVDHFTFKEEEQIAFTNAGIGRAKDQRNIWNKILDGESIIGKSVNKARGNGYVTYTDDVRELILDDPEGIHMAANKPGKGRFGDAGAAQKDKEGLMKFLAHPEDDKSFEGLAGNNRGYNDVATEHTRNAKWVEAGIDMVAAPVFTRNFVSPTIGGLLELVIPEIFSSPMRKMFHEFGISKNSEQIRATISILDTKEITSIAYIRKIKKKYRIGVGYSIIPWLIEFLDLLGLGLIAHPEELTGMK